MPVTARIAPCQSPAAQSEQETLTASQEKDSYEIYSMLLRTEMPAQWNITAWAIKQETQTFPSHGAINRGAVDVCLQPTKAQDSRYRPLMDDYSARNKKALVLERQFDLPQFALIGPTDIKAIQQRSRIDDGFPFNASVVFHVSAVGFSRDGMRALVYVGHDCGSLCGGGKYHLLVKKDGRWQVDRDFWGMSCMWAA